MYRIEKRPSGFLLTFGGFITVAEMEQWCRECEQALGTVTAPFGVVVDMRTLTPLVSDAQQLMIKGQALFKGKGMRRSAVVVENAITAVQFKRLAKESGIYAWERYIDASAVPDWESVAVQWVKDGIDPDAKPASVKAG
jgi:hypothetical protein